MGDKGVGGIYGSGDCSYTGVPGDDDYYRDLRRATGRPITIVSHPRSGTHLAIDLLRRQFNACNARKWPWERYDALYVPLERVIEDGHSTALLNIARRFGRPVVKCHAYSLPALRDRAPEWYRWAITHGQLIYLAREPFSMLESLYYYFLPFVESTRVPFGEFIRQPFASGANRVSFWSDEVVEWSGRKDTLFLTYEQLVAQPKEAIEAVSQYLGEPACWHYPLLPRRPRSHWAMRISRFLSCAPQSTAILGDSGGVMSKRFNIEWTDADIAFVKQQAADGISRLPVG